MPQRIETAADGDTTFLSESRTGTDFTTGSGPVNRYIHDPSDWSNGQWIVPLGSSGHPGSPHYADQLPTWAEVEMVPMTYSADAVSAAAQTTQTLKPD